jgi:hypothetical protein
MDIRHCTITETTNPLIRTGVLFKLPQNANTCLENREERMKATSLTRSPSHSRGLGTSREEEEGRAGEPVCSP